MPVSGVNQFHPSGPLHIFLHGFEVIDLLPKLTLIFVDHVFSEKDNAVPLHYLLLVGLLLLFSSCLPFLFPPTQLMCALRPALPGIAFGIILSRSAIDN